MNDRRSFLRIAVIVGVFGLLSLAAMLDRPSLADVRAVDFVHLIGTGMCLGAAIFSLGMHFRSPR